MCLVCFVVNLLMGTTKYEIHEKKSQHDVLVFQLELRFMDPIHAEKSRKGALHEPENARLDSEGLTRFRFMVPMHGRNGEGALHELRLVWSSAFRRLEPPGPPEGGTPYR